MKQSEENTEIVHTALNEVKASSWFLKAIINLTDFSEKAARDQGDSSCRSKYESTFEMLKKKVVTESPLH